MGPEVASPEVASPEVANQSADPPITNPHDSSPYSQIQSNHDPLPGWSSPIQSPSSDSVDSKSHTDIPQIQSVNSPAEPESDYAGPVYSPNSATYGHESYDYEVSNVHVVPNNEYLEHYNQFYLEFT